MAMLDNAYLGDLVQLAKDGSGDAFGELFGATCQSQYKFSYSFFKDEILAQNALQNTYCTALRNLSRLQDPKLFVNWLNQINFRVCCGMADKNHSSTVRSDMDCVVDGNCYKLKDILSLSSTQAQIAFLRYFRDFSTKDISEILEMSEGRVKDYLGAAKERLKFSQFRTGKRG